MASHGQSAGDSTTISTSGNHVILGGTVSNKSPFLLVVIIG